MTAARSIREGTRAIIGGLPPPFWAIWWGLLVNRLAFFVLAFLPSYLVRERGLGPVGAGRIVALFGAGIALAGPLGGVLADRVGRRVTMVGGLLCGAASVAALTSSRSLPALATLAFLTGTTTELYRPAMAASVADVVPVHDRRRAYGLVYWAMNLGPSVGLLVAGLVAERSFVALFLADAATCVGFAAILSLRVPETRPQGAVHVSAVRGLLRVFADRHFAVLLLLQLAALVVFLQWQFGLQLDMAAHGLGPSAYAVLMSFNCAGVVFLQPALASRTSRFDAARLLATMALLFGLGFGVNAIGGSVLIYGIGAALWTVGEVVGFPAAEALVTDLAPIELRGRYQGAFSSAKGLSFTLAPLVGGEIYGRLGGRALWLACLLVALMVAVGHLAAGRARRRRPAARAAGCTSSDVRSVEVAEPSAE